jgi:SpoVK/Ycf46/Vps4 family AAA+-type ATPase
MLGGPPKLTDYGQLLEPGEALKPILARPVRNALLEWLTEIWSKDDLKKVGLKARSKALFTGPPGVGKTTLAHHLAARLGLRMIAVRPDRIIDCWVGSSSRNLGGLFECAREEKEPVVLFFDEFDSIAGKRLAVRQGADAHYNEMVNTLLQRLEAHDGYVIAATNFGDQLDEAAWRRFDVQIALALPGRDECAAILARYFKPYILPKRSLHGLAEAFETATPALMRQFAEAIKRQLVIGPKCEWDMRKEAVIERLLIAVQPHPELGKPRLWSLGKNDPALSALPWPLSTERVADAFEETEEREPTANVVSLRGPR